jgi:predicted esterase
MRESQLHQGQPVLTAGVALEAAKAAMIMLHGRGASAEDMMALAAHLQHPSFAYLAPQAANYTWYPERFMEPIERNEPWLSSALDLVATLVQRVNAAGIDASRTMILGFSQGACLTLEYAARNARRYGGIVGLSGGLIGPDDTPRNHRGTFDATPTFLGCSDVDPHIPLKRVHDTATFFAWMGADTIERIYPGMGHTVSLDEIK